MAAAPFFDPDERQAIATLVRSAGWAVVMRRLCLPQMQQATARLEGMALRADRQQDDVMRGIKYAYKVLIETLYREAEVPNPIEQHAMALWAAVGPPSEESLAGHASPAMEEDRPPDVTRRMNFQA